MNKNKEQLIDMYIKRLVKTVIYTDVLYRILNEFIQNQNSNFKEYDIANLSELLSKYVRRLKLNIFNMHNDWEFFDSRYKYKQ